MSYALGIVLAICAGVAINIGTVMQKKAVNAVPPEKRDQAFMKTLLHDKLWLSGLLVQLALGTTLVIVAQIFIGPALLPGLLATGLIAMAIGAAKLVNEKLNTIEIIAICLIVVSTILLTLTNLAVAITEVDLANPGFLSREFTFTAVYFLIVIFCIIYQKYNQRIRSLLFAIASGCLLALANYWVSPVTGNIMHLFAGTVSMPWELVTGIIGGVILAITNIFAISTLQNGFKFGNANTVIPIQQVPVNIAPIFVYFFVFAKVSPSNYAIPLLIIAICIIIVCSYILAKRQMQLEAIKQIETVSNEKVKTIEKPMN